MCGDGECILQELVCNNEVDCNDGLDEYRCGKLKTQQAAICLLKNATIFCRLMIKITPPFLLVYLKTKSRQLRMVYFMKCSF